MRYLYRFIIVICFCYTTHCYALELFLDVLDWRATESNDWAYFNSETLPNQTISYKTIDFNYSPGFRIGGRYHCDWDLLFSYSHYNTSATDSAVGPLQPAFLGSVTAKPSHAFLYSSGNVRQYINFNILDLNFGKNWHASNYIVFHPFIGLMGGWIHQTINAHYQGRTSSSETITNNFLGLGPKVGLDLNLNLWKACTYQPKLIAGLAATYLFASWDIEDIAHATPLKTINVTGNPPEMGALTLQSFIGLKIQYKEFAGQLVYEISDWFNQNQFFDNDTGAHNNDLVLQGINLGVSYNIPL